MSFVVTMNKKMEMKLEMKTISKRGQQIEEALSRLDTCTKEKSPKIGDALANLAFVYFIDKQLEESVKWERKALKFFSSSPDHVNKLAKTMYNLAVTLSELDRFEEASRLLEKSLSLYTSFIPADHYYEQIGSAMDNLAINQFVLGKREEALRISKESLAYYQDHLPLDHPRIVRALEAVKIVSSSTTAPTDIRLIRLLPVTTTTTATTEHPVSPVTTTTTVTTEHPVSTVTTTTQEVTMITATTAPPVSKTTTVAALSTTTTNIT